MLNATCHPLPEHAVRRGTGQLHFLGKMICLGLSCPSLLLPMSVQLRCKQAASLTGVSENDWTCYWTPGTIGTHYILKFPKENSTFSCKTYVFPGANFSSAKIAFPRRKSPNHIYTQRQILGKTFLGPLPLTYVFFFWSHVISGTQALSHGWNG